jgi:hypothetical protein
LIGFLSKVGPWTTKVDKNKFFFKSKRYKIAKLTNLPGKRTAPMKIFTQKFIKQKKSWFLRKRGGSCDWANEEVKISTLGNVEVYKSEHS